MVLLSSKSGLPLETRPAARAPIYSASCWTLPPDSPVPCPSCNPGLCSGDSPQRLQKHRECTGLRIHQLTAASQRHSSTGPTPCPCPRRSSGLGLPDPPPGTASAAGQELRASRKLTSPYRGARACDSSRGHRHLLVSLGAPERVEVSRRMGDGG